MELRQLKYFVKSAEYLNFSVAAKHLYITQSTLSQQIKQLEFELGFELFLRNSRHISLTEAGEEFLPLHVRQYRMPRTVYSVCMTYSMSRPVN